MNTLLRLSAAAVVALVLAACGKADAPEAQVRATIAQAEAAAEKKEVGTLRDMVSATYADAEGHDKRAIEGVLRFYFLRNQSIHLVTRVSSVTVSHADKAHAVIYVGMAAQPIAGVDELERLRADLFRFDIDFANEDGEWRVFKAEWRRVELADFVK